MPIVRQVICCPVCGSSRKLVEYGMDSHGNLTAIVARLPILKIQQNGERGRMIWTSYDLPLGALRSFIQHLENVLESARTRLAEIPEDE